MTPAKDTHAKRLFLIDGSALAYRSHFAFIRNPLTTSKGQNVSAVFGFIHALLRILDQEKPEFCSVIFDTPEPTFRHKKYKEYKATREKTPEELVEQLPLIKTISEKMGITVMEVPGWEADDVIGTLAMEAAGKKVDVFLVSGDKDFMQLVTDRIVIYNIAKADEDVVLLDPDGVKDKFGVAPDKIIEVMGLMGDSSDNVPGVRGVGQKTALKLIDEHGSIDALYENLDQVSAKGLKTKLTNGREAAFLSRDLVTIDTNVPLKITHENLVIGEKDVAELRELFLDLELNQLLNRLVAPESRPDESSREYILVDSKAKYDRFLKNLKKAKFLVLDTETTSLNPLAAYLVGISISFTEGEAFYLPANLKKPIFDKAGGDIEVFLNDLKGPLADPRISICGQNIKYDLMVLERAGINDVQGVSFDTMIAHYLLFPGEMRHNLDYLAMKYLKIKKIPTVDLIGKGKNQISMADVPVDRVGDYACEDADVTLRLKNILEPALEEEALHDLFSQVEMPLVRVLESMERVGVRVDKKMLQTMSSDLGARLDDLADSIYEQAGMQFNINSTQQLGKVLFEKLAIHEELGIKRVKKTKTGYATNAAVLESMTAHPFPRAILEYRQLKKLKSTYLDALPRLIDPGTGRIHTSFNQTVTATGRLSSSDPNLQNIPIRTELGRKIREAFIPGDDDSILVSADYSQIELRILAHVSEDEALIQAFNRGEDIHRGTAALIFDVPPDEVTSTMRSRAKTINFGIIYGMGPHRLARELGISFFDAEQFITSYFEAFSGVKEYLDRTLESARKTEVVSTLLGRKRRIEEINSSNGQIRAMAENVAVNTPIQGTAADLIKKAMIDIHQALNEEQMRARMIIQVHDELLFDLPADELDKLEALVRKKMEGALSLRVPILVEIGHGKNWLEAH